MKKSSKSPLKKRSLDISLQHKNQASYKFSKKKLLHLAKNKAVGERVKHPIMNFEKKKKKKMFSVLRMHPLSRD